MERISTATKVADLFGAGKHGWRDGDVAGGVVPTYANAAWFNTVQEELANVVELSGTVLTPGNRTQLAQAIQAGKLFTGAAGGTADAITSAFSPAITALKDGMALYVRGALANATNAPTFTPNNGTIAPKVIVKGAGAALVSGDIAGAGHWIEVQYDLTLDKWVLLNPATGVSAGGGQQPGEICYFARNTAPAGFLKANGVAISRATYAALFAAIYKTATVAMTIAAPGVITWNSHGLSANDPVQFTSTGLLPTGFLTATNYYVVGASITTNTFQLSATPGGAAIATTGSQSGIHTAHNAPFGIGDGSTTFNVPDLRGEFLRGWDDSRGIDASRAFGSSQSQDMQPHQHVTDGTLSGSKSMVWLGGTDGPVDYISSINTANDAAYVSGSKTGLYGTTETRPRNVSMLACIKY